MRLHQIQGYIQNIFLAEYNHGCMLLDGACKADFDDIKAYFKNVLKRPFSDLKVVIVTHMHPDHAGCAHKLREATGCKVYTGRFNQQWYKGSSGYIAYLIDIGLAYWVANRLQKPKKHMFYPRFLDADALLDDMQTIPEFEEWKIHATPGHTDRDISVINDTRKMLYVADLIVYVKGKYTSPFPVYLPNEYKTSVSSLSEYIGYDLCMAHVPQTKLNQDIISQVLDAAPLSPQTNLNVVRKKIKRIKQIRR